MLISLFKILTRSVSKYQLKFLFHPQLSSSATAIKKIRVLCEIRDSDKYPQSP